MSTDARGRIEFDAAKLNRVTQDFIAAARAAERVKARVERAQNAGNALTQRTIATPGRLSVVAAGFLSAEKFGEVARGLGRGEALDAIIRRQIESFARGPLRNLLRPFVVGLILDYLDARDERNLELLNERFEREREKNDIARRLREDPYFADEAARQASREFESSEERRRQLEQARAQQER